MAFVTAVAVAMHDHAFLLRARRRVLDRVFLHQVLVLDVQAVVHAVNDVTANLGPFAVQLAVAARVDLVVLRRPMNVVAVRYQLPTVCLAGVMAAGVDLAVLVGSPAHPVAGRSGAVEVGVVAASGVGVVTVVAMSAVPVAVTTMVSAVSAGVVPTVTAMRTTATAAAAPAGHYASSGFAGFGSATTGSGSTSTTGSGSATGSSHSCDSPGANTTVRSVPSSAGTVKAVTTVSPVSFVKEGISPPPMPG